MWPWESRTERLLRERVGQLEGELAESRKELAAERERGSQLVDKIVLLAGLRPIGAGGGEHEVDRPEPPNILFPQRGPRPLRERRQEALERSRAESERRRAQEEKAKAARQ